jgi:hypothetical protein
MLSSRGIKLGCRSGDAILSPSPLRRSKVHVKHLFNQNMKSETGARSPTATSIRDFRITRYLLFDGIAHHRLYSWVPDCHRRDSEQRVADKPMSRRKIWSSWWQFQLEDCGKAWVS